MSDRALLMNDDVSLYLLAFPFLGYPTIKLFLIVKNLNMESEALRAATSSVSGTKSLPPPLLSKNVHAKYAIKSRVPPLLRKGSPLKATCSNSYFLHLTRTWDQVIIAYLENSKSLTHASSDRYVGKSDDSTAHSKRLYSG